LGAAAHSLIVLGAVGLALRAGGGLYVVAAALVLALVRALGDIWILFTGMAETELKQRLLRQNVTTHSDPGTPAWLADCAPSGRRSGSAREQASG
jgi:hypothetical protein